MGYSMRSQYGVVLDASDRAALKAWRCTDGMWKGVSRNSHCMIRRTCEDIQWTKGFK